MSIIYPEFNFQVEEWDETNYHVTTLALMVDVHTAINTYEYIVSQRPNRIIYLRNGSRLMKRHGPPRPDADVISLR